MVTEKAKYKLRVLQFYKEHGLRATVDAFRVKPRTLYWWQSQLQQGKSNIVCLNEGSKRPYRVRRRMWSSQVICEIRRLRNIYPNLGKEKVHIFLKTFCQLKNIKCPGIRTIGRLIHDATDKMRQAPIKPKRRVCRKAPRYRKPKAFKAQYPGHCIALDTIEKFKDGLKRYIITCTDTYTRLSFALATKSHASAEAQKFFELVQTLLPYKIDTVLTDNGSEFLKHFSAQLNNVKIRHYFTYPKTPKMNAHCERFNRTIQEEFIDYYENDLFEEQPHAFNDKLLDYLFWYNTKRPHWSLDLKSPIQFLTNKFPQYCNMYWPNTKTCLLYSLGLGI